MDSINSTVLSQDLSLWLSFFFSLMIFSMVAGDNFLSKLAQYILVGVAMGYLGTLAIQHVLRPRLLSPLFNAPFGFDLVTLRYWIILLLGVLLCVAGMARVIAQTPGERPPDNKHAGRHLLHTLGIIPVAILLGVGTSVLMTGVLQGTLWPQFWHAARSGLAVRDTVWATLSTVLVLLLTTAIFLHWSVPVEPITANQPAWVRHLLRLWAGIGKRALWFASGVLFARLFASYLTLFIARLQFLLTILEESVLWRWAEMVWRGVAGG